MEGRGYQIQAFPAEDDKQINRILVHYITYDPLSKISRYEIVKCAVGANTITSLHSVPHNISLSLNHVHHGHITASPFVDN